MKILVKEEQLRRLFEQSEKIEPYVISLFKVLNREKKNYKKKSDLLKFIKKLVPFLNIPEGFEKYLLELYVLNYRKDGDYSELSKNNFIDPRKQKGKVTSNAMSNQYTRAQLPFKGSNLEGYWTNDINGVPYYVVKSYGWYPVYLFKNGIWYEISDRYSSSTSKQMFRSSPITSENNKELQEKVFLVTKEEMKMLENDATHEDILENKLKKIKEIEPELQKKKMRSVTQNVFYDEDADEMSIEYKVKFKINSVDIQDGVAIINVDIYDVLKKEGNKTIPTPENYLKGELINITPSKVEKTVENKLRQDFREYIGPQFIWGKELPKGSKIRFKFNHLKK